MNLLPYLTGEKAGAGTQIAYGPKRAIRMGDWKLTDEGDGAKLYNIATDISEKVDVAAREPVKLKELAAAYDAWNANNVPAKWGSRGKQAKSVGQNDE